jgi:hypothetical protein
MRFREQRWIGTDPFNPLLALEEVELAVAHHERGWIGLHAATLGQVPGAQAAKLRRVALGILGEELAVLPAGER